MIDDVRKFMEAADCTTDEFNVRQTALYIGLQLEEMAEKLEAVFSSEDTVVTMLEFESSCFKRGIYDDRLHSIDRKEILDADIDLMWVTIGSVLSQGADIHGAIAEVNRSNASKLVGGKMVKDRDGKVTKGRNYSPPNLEPFVIGAK